MRPMPCPTTRTASGAQPFQRAATLAHESLVLHTESVRSVSETQTGVVPLPEPRERKKKTSQSDGKVDAVIRACAILNLLQASTHDMPLKRIASATGLAKPTVSRYMSTLCGERYAIQDAQSGHFRAGPGLLRWLPHYLGQLRERALQHLGALRDEFDETVSFAILDGDSVLLLDVVQSRGWLRIAGTVESHLPLHSSGLGKAIAAYLSEERVHEIFTRVGLPALTENTITTIEGYFSELAKVRDLGYAVDEQEHDPGIRCVAVPILGTTPPAAISVSAPATRLDDQKFTTIVERLLHVAQLIAGQSLPVTTLLDEDR